MKAKVNKSVIITGLLCLTAMEIVALYKGINGVLLTTIVGIIALAIGVAIPQGVIKK